MREVSALRLHGTNVKMKHHFINIDTSTSTPKNLRIVVLLFVLQIILNEKFAKLYVTLQCQPMDKIYDCVMGHILFQGDIIIMISLFVTLVTSLWVSFKIKPNYLQRNHINVDISVDNNKNTCSFL